MRISKAVFPAAGLGTRFLPATKAQPKEMLPLVDKPLIQYVVEEAVNAGIRNITYVRQKEALGLGHAILMSRDAVGNEPFAVMLGDDIIDAPVPCLKQMMDLFEKLQGSIIATCEVPHSEIHHYGVIRGVPLEGFNGRVYRIQDVVEKPPSAEAPSNMAIIGRYILTPEIFPILERTRTGRGGEIQLTDGIRILLEQQPVYAYKFDGTRYDAGDKLGFLKATVEFALRREDLGKDFRNYLASLKL